MKKYFLLWMISLFGFFFVQADDYYFCGGGDYESDDYFYNLFLQEIIDDPQYFPFLRTDEPFYASSFDAEQPNENIEAWETYLQISYEQAKYLVFTVTREEIQAILKNNSTADKSLNFIDESFVKQHKQALRYLSYAKYLAPYMRIIQDERYSWDDELHVGKLDYDQFINVLERSWHAEDDPELKLRYGYQLVRFAHYNKKFETAINYFKEYVESLNHQTIMYYYALEQKAGAEYGLGNFLQANRDFFEVFLHTKNRKEEAYRSMRFSYDLDLEELFTSATSQEAKNDVYLLIGYNNFNNPVHSIEKIIEHTPDAVQAKVLMARAINQLERNFFPVRYYCPWDQQNCWKNLKDRKLPISLDKNAIDFLESTLKIAKKQAQDTQVEDRDFWNYTTAYLYFIQKKYKESQTYLSRVKSSTKIYDQQKEQLKILIHIAQAEKIDHQFEQDFYKNYSSWIENYSRRQGNSTAEFIMDILANRYLLQGDYAKSFLLHNDIDNLMADPDLNLALSIEEFYKKPNKNEFEKYISQTSTGNYPDISSFLSQLKGTIFLSKGQPEKALEEFKNVKDNFKFKTYFYDEPQTDYNGYDHIPNTVFGYNRIECFACDTNNMQVVYLEEFPFIQKRMNKRQLTENIIALEKIAKEETNLGAKANFLLANFYYNISSFGFHRELLSFQITNDNSSRFGNFGRRWSAHNISKDYSERLYFKNYETALYQDDFDRIQPYISKGISFADDDELKARLIFAEAKIELILFYKTIYENSQPDYYINFNDKELIDYKVKNFRTSFKTLTENYSHTDYFQKVKTYCKTFDYYLSNY